MPQQKYRIYELSARAVISHAREVDGVYRFHLNQRATEKCKSVSALHEQDDNALFFQTMCVLHGNDFAVPSDDRLITDLSDVIFYMNFEGIFDHSGTGKQLERQRKAKDMFRPEGVCLNFGSGEHHYLAFERSGSMSRQARLSFIRADVYEEVRRRIMLDMQIGDCQLSKLYAYNGLMLSSGTRIENIGIDSPHRVIVIDNIKRTIKNVRVITVADDGTNNCTRKYYREETSKDITITCFDGEGLISKEYAKTLDKAYCGRHLHTSFQIRLPYIKGMLHQVDFKQFFHSAGTKTITDLWGVVHQIDDVDVILTKSQFKGYGWLKDNGMSWDDYWEAFRRYRHALYITNTSKEVPAGYTELNYQFLTTVSIRADEFRPADLPDGWDHSPAEDSRNWLTKQTELVYYNFCANKQFRQNYFLYELKQRGLFNKKSRAYHLASILKKNPLFINEPVYANELESMANKILKQYAVGRLLVAGDNRYLSGDLLDFLVLLLDGKQVRTKRQRTFYDIAVANQFPESAFYAPGAVYEHDETCTLLRNPHIARNEELQLSLYDDKNNMRKFFLGHLTDVVMVNAYMLAAERLGGADYDGDMIRTIADPILNACVRRNYDYERFVKYKSFTNEENIPLLMIPSVEAQIRNADDWEARFETVSSTFSARIGQICNAALDRSIIAYNENSDTEERQRCREETETLAILTGLEIDSAKSGVKPDLSEYLGGHTVKRTAFLRYKTLVENAEERRTWYEPTHKEKIRKFFQKTDWEQVDSNVERLPYLARKLRENTPRITSIPAEDNDLFVFAQKDGWERALNQQYLSAISALLEDYKECLSRIRSCRVPLRNKQRKKDIDRILYSRGQEDIYDADELYALFQTLPAERISLLRLALREQAWHFTDTETRESFLLEYLPEQDFVEYYDLLSDFRHSGFRILGDLVCDIDDENADSTRKDLIRKNDSDAFKIMMDAYINKPASQGYREAVSTCCRFILDQIVKPSQAVAYVVALGERALIWDLLVDQIEKSVLRREDRHAE